MHEKPCLTPILQQMKTFMTAFFSFLEQHYGSAVCNFIDLQGVSSLEYVSSFHNPAIKILNTIDKQNRVLEYHLLPNWATNANRKHCFLRFFIRVYC